MAEFPALPLFTDSLIADTEHLSDESFGAYLRLLIKVWRSPNCRIPCADAWLIHMHRGDVNKFNGLIKPLLSEFFQSDGAFYIQKRLLKEFNYVRDTRSKKRGAAKARWNKEKDPCISNAPHPTPPPIPNSSNELFGETTPTTKPKGMRNAKPRRSLSPVPDDFQPDFSGLGLAAELGVDLEPAIREFIDFWKSNGDSKADWQATFRNRLRQLAQRSAENSKRDSVRRSNVQDVTGAALRVVTLRNGGQA